MVFATSEDLGHHLKAFSGGERKHRESIRDMLFQLSFDEYRLHGSADYQVWLISQIVLGKDIDKKDSENSKV
jgi:hypothetical protein